MLDYAKIKYGGPQDRTKPYYPDIYCFVCGKVPTVNVWDDEKNKGRIKIPELFIVPMEKKFIATGVVEEVAMIGICPKCIEDIGRRMNRMMGGNGGPVML